MNDSEHHQVTSLQKLLDFTGRLNQHKIYYTLCRHRDDAVMVKVDVPGERWEVEFFPGGEVEVEVFQSTGLGVVGGPEAHAKLNRLVENHGA